MKFFSATFAIYDSNNKFVREEIKIQEVEDDAIVETALCKMFPGLIKSEDQVCRVVSHQLAGSFPTFDQARDAAASTRINILIKSI